MWYRGAMLCCEIQLVEFSRVEHQHLTHLTRVYFHGSFYLQGVLSHLCGPFAPTYIGPFTIMGPFTPRLGVRGWSTPALYTAADLGITLKHCYQKAQKNTKKFIS